MKFKSFRLIGGGLEFIPEWLIGHGAAESWMADVSVIEFGAKGRQGRFRCRVKFSRQVSWAKASTNKRS